MQGHYKTIATGHLLYRHLFSRSYFTDITVLQSMSSEHCMAPL